MHLRDTDQQRAFRAEIKQLVNASKERYGDYAYATGYLTQLAVELLGYLPKTQQTRLIRGLEDARARAAESKSAG